MWASLGCIILPATAWEEQGVNINTVNHAPTSDCVPSAYLLYPDLTLRNIPSGAVALPDCIACLLNYRHYLLAPKSAAWKASAGISVHFRRFRNYYMLFSL